MPSPSAGLTQPERVEASARRLASAAAELIAEKGWDATTAAEIGRRAGYSRAMVHARYGNKDAILDTLFKATYEKRLDVTPPPGVDGLTRALLHIDRVLELYAEDRSFTRAMLVLTFEAVKSGSPIRRRVQTWFGEVRSTVEAGLQAGIRDRSVRGDVDLTQATTDISTAGLGVAYQWIVFGDDVPLDCELKLMRDRMIRYYGVRSSRRR